MLKRFVPGVVSALILMTTGCQATGGTQVQGLDNTAEQLIPVEVLGRGTNCAPGQTGFTVIMDGNSGDAGGAARRWAADLNFERHWLVVIRQGTKPTLGYSVELDSDFAKVRDGTALIRVTMNEPAAGSMVGQAISHPCLVVALPRPGLESVTVVDQHSDVVGNAPARPRTQPTR